MLEDCLIESRPSARTKRPFTLVVSVLTHGGLVAALLLIPLFQEQLLPHIALFDPLPPPTVRSQVMDVAPAASQASAAPAVPPAPTALLAPQEIPREIVRYMDQPIAGTQGFLPAGPGGGIVGLRIGLPFGDTGDRVSTPPPPPPPAPIPASPKPPDVPQAPAAPLPRGGDVMRSSLIHQVTPSYPGLARATRTQGPVLIEAVITREGTIDPARLRIISGHILLVDAAREAVLQWRYKPTLLNGQPIEILTTITITFSLN